MSHPEASGDNTVDMTNQQFHEQQRQDRARSESPASYARCMFCGFVPELDAEHGHNPFCTVAYLEARLVALEREREEDRRAIRDMKHAMKSAARDLFALQEPTRAHRLLDVTKTHATAIQRAQERP